MAAPCSSFRERLLSSSVLPPGATALTSQARDPSPSLRSEGAHQHASWSGGGDPLFLQGWGAGFPPADHPPVRGWVLCWALRGG